jgi:tetratricopeptide (TPR) repeat protein
VELMPPGNDTVSGASTDAARRAGATELIEGEIQPDPAGLVMTFRRVALETGVVVQGYQVRAGDRYALVDSATAALARDLHLTPPGGAVADVRTPSPAAYAIYEEGLRAYYQYDGPAAYRLMTAALERDSSFAMAAYYAWMAGRGLVDEAEGNRTLQLAKRLAPRASERERLLIEGAVAALDAPISQAVAIAETLTVRYPMDPDGQILLGEARFQNGEWARAVSALERAVAIDSAAGATGGSYCRICTSLAVLAHTYLWWDSAGAAERSARRLIALRPHDHIGWNNLVEPLLRQGRRVEAEAAAEQGIALSMARFSSRPNLDRDLLRWGRFEELDRVLRPDLQSPTPSTRDEARWLLWIGLRYQGRLREAGKLVTDPTQASILALETGRPAEAGRLFEERARQMAASDAPPGFKARTQAWMLTLAGTAWATAGDTVKVRRLVDSVESIGAASSFGRDSRLHFFLRGVLLQQQGRHAEAVEAFRNSVFSLTDGYTMTNLLMARSLMALGRIQEAIGVLQPALRGGVDGSNTYTSRTDLHEALAEAFDLAGMRDSALVHFAVVEHAWRQADPAYADRYQQARTRVGLR